MKFGWKIKGGEAAELPGQPLVTDVSAELAYSSADDDLRHRVDLAYQELLEALQQVRREAAEAAADVIEELPLTKDELAAARKREQELTARSQRLQRVPDREGNSQGDVYRRRGQPQSARSYRGCRIARRPRRSCCHGRRLSGPE